MDQPNVAPLAGTIALVAGATRGAGRGTGDILQQPLQFAGREIRVQHQPGLGPNRTVCAVGTQTITGGGGAAILPNDGIVNRLPAAAIPIGMPSTVQKNTAVTTIDSVVMVSGHSPIMSMKASAIRLQTYQGRLMPKLPKTRRNSV